MEVESGTEAGAGLHLGIGLGMDAGPQAVKGIADKAVVGDSAECEEGWAAARCIARLNVINAIHPVTDAQQGFSMQHTSTPGLGTLSDPTVTTQYHEYNNSKEFDITDYGPSLDGPIPRPFRAIPKAKVSNKRKQASRPNEMDTTEGGDPSMTSLPIATDVCPPLRISKRKRTLLTRAPRDDGSGDLEERALQGPRAGASSHCVEEPASRSPKEEGPSYEPPRPKKKSKVNGTEVGRGASKQGTGSRKAIGQHVAGRTRAESRPERSYAIGRDDHATVETVAVFSKLSDHGPPPPPPGSNIARSSLDERSLSTFRYAEEKQGSRMQLRSTAKGAWTTLAPGTVY